MSDVAFTCPPRYCQHKVSLREGITSCLAERLTSPKESFGLAVAATLIPR